MVHEALPSVKCSSCGQPVPLANLGDHTCPPLPPSNLQKQPMFQKHAPTLIPQRLHSLVARSDTRSFSEKHSEDSEVERVLSLLTPSRDPFQRLLPDKSSMATPKTPNVPFPKNSPPTSLPLDRLLPGASTPPPPDRVSTPVRDPIPPALQRTRVPSNASRAAPSSPARVTFSTQLESTSHPVPRRPSPLSSARRDNPPPPPTQQPLAPPRSPFTDRASSNAAHLSTIHPRPSFERAHTTSTVAATRPSLDKFPPFLDEFRPALDARWPSIDSQNPSMEQNSSSPPNVHFARPPRTAAAPFPSSAPVLPLPVSARQPPPPPLSLVYSRAHVMDREIDTKIGGEAGMAGVGRRGFVLAASRSPHQPAHVTALGDGHRVNVPRYLDTNDTLSLVMRAAMTPPPLSPNSVQTPSPVSPRPASPGNNTHINGRHPNPPSSHGAILQRSSVPASNDKVLPLQFSPSDVRIASPSRSPSPIPNPFERRLSSETITQSPLPGASLPLPLFDILKSDLGNESDDESVYTTHTDLRRDENEPSSPSAGSDVGLAYAQDSDDDTPVVTPLDIRKSSLKGGMNKIKFPTSASSGGRLPSRQTSTTSLRSVMSFSDAFPWSSC
ncbi:hypothetical protein L210DRAFT_2825059 [Boletus edulis BED1]|uniref:Uncharacterized protein n=1 Tax=Boletus edulis BED1 TaxID=1328754 RepID=A0AAD4C437_BOLED|nr:hypothetical protein L210DRAFT_2825059 [Boletus edulis BED1]